MSAATAGDLWHLQNAFVHLPGEGSLDAVLSWCRLEPRVRTEIGAFPGWELEFPNYNHANYGGYAHLAPALGSSAALARLRSAAGEADGRLNARVARLSAFSYREAGKLPEWTAFLEEMLSSAGLQGDTRVSWLTARAYAEELREPEPLILEGRAWLEEALSVAQSEGLRLEALGELISRVASGGRIAEARSILQSVEEQFESAESRAAIASWRSQMGALEVHYRDLAGAQGAKAKEAYIAELQARLARANERGDAENIALYQHLLEEAQ